MTKSAHRAVLFPTSGFLYYMGILQNTKTDPDRMGGNMKGRRDKEEGDVREISPSVGDGYKDGEIGKWVGG